MIRPLNLSRRPFANTRPVLRVTTLLWIVGGVLTLVNLWLYWGALFGIEDRRELAAELAQQIGEEQSRSSAAQRGLREMDLLQQNRRTAYLNRRIAERTFPWSRLFDDLAEVLPLRVRLLSLAPQVEDARERRARPGRPVAETNADQPRRVQLRIRGAAEGDEALLDLLDHLFASSLFERPSLPRESRQADGSLQFDLGVDYLPDRPWRVEPAQIGGEPEPAWEGAPGPHDEEPTAVAGEPGEARLEGATPRNGLGPAGGHPEVSE